MKRLFIAAVALGLATPAMAVTSDWFIQWQNTGTGLATDAGPPPVGITPNLGDRALFELVWAGPDGQIDGIVYDDGSTDGDDMTLATYIHENTGPTTGSLFGFFATSFGGPDTPFLGSEVYMRGYGAEAVVAGTPFAVSPITSVVAKDYDAPGSPTPDQVNWGGGLVLLDQTVQVIPEPMSVAMLAVGALTVFVRHRRRS